MKLLIVLVTIAGLSLLHLNAQNSFLNQCETDVLQQYPPTAVVNDPNGYANAMANCNNQASFWHF